ncbi:non-homologous end-joining DNA ligase [Paraburkholderia franconis]|nr:non-homologous end-joining DNA ligase [Paraburkholderia franconis]
MPLLIEPEPATLATHPPSRGDWQYEIKLDGYRMLARIDHGAVRLVARNGHDWTTRLPKLRDALARLPVDDVWLDGEAVVVDKEGRPDFNALQNAFDRRSTANITLYLFDLLWLDGIDRRDQPLTTRRRLLRELLEIVDEPLIRFSESFDEDPAQLIEAARSMKLEGIIGKRVGAPYRSGRSTSWIKLKCERRQEFVVGGISRGSAGAALGLGRYIDGVTTHGFYNAGTYPAHPPELYDTDPANVANALDRQMQQLRSTMQTVKPNMRLWSTELGISYDANITYGSSSISANQLYAQGIDGDFIAYSLVRRLFGLRDACIRNEPDGGLTHETFFMHSTLSAKTTRVYAVRLASANGRVS